MRIGIGGPKKTALIAARAHLHRERAPLEGHAVAQTPQTIRIINSCREAYYSCRINQFEMGSPGTDSRQNVTRRQTMILPHRKKTLVLGLSFLLLLFGWWFYDSALALPGRAAPPTVLEVTNRDGGFAMAFSPDRHWFAFVNRTNRRVF